METIVGVSLETKEKNGVHVGRSSSADRSIQVGPAPSISLLMGFYGILTTSQPILEGEIPSPGYSRQSYPLQLVDALWSP